MLPPDGVVRGTESAMSNSRLHVLITDPHLQGGGQITYVLRLAEELSRRGHRITIGCREGSLLAQRAEAHGANVLDGFNFRGGLRPRCWRHDFLTLAQYLRLQHPDIVHVNGSQDHWTAALAHRAVGGPLRLVRTRHNTYAVKDSLPNRMLNRNWTDYQIVVCDMVRQTLARQRTFDADRMCTIHNGVDADAFQHNEIARQRLRREFGYAPTHLVVGIVARLVEDKGHAFLLKAAAQLRASHAELRLLLLGQGPLEHRLRQLAQELEICDITTFAGYRQDMADCVQAIDIGVQPSIGCDTSSFSLKELMAAKKPVVASNYGGLTEIVADGIEGVIVPAGTVEPLSKALRQLLADSELRARMGAAGRARVLAEFTSEVFATRTLEAYYRALALQR